MAKRIAVIGLGRFGKHLALELAHRGAEVLALDLSLDELDDVKDHVAHTVRLDSTETEPMTAQDLTDYDSVVVAMGEDFEATLLTVAVLQQIGVNRIIVRAATSVHERILQHLGVKEVVLPAEEAADRLANSLVLEGVTESFSISTDYTIIEATVPEAFVGRTLEQLALPANHRVSVVTIKRQEMRPRLLGFGKRSVEHILGIPSAETTLERGDVLVVFGRKQDIEKLLEQEEM